MLNESYMEVLSIHDTETSKTIALKELFRDNDKVIVDLDKFKDVAHEDEGNYFNIAGKGDYARPEVGEIVYFVRRNSYRWEIGFGLLLANYDNCCVVQLLTLYNYMTVNGVRYDKFPYCSKWYNLPKKFSYSSNTLIEDHSDIDYKPLYDCIINEGLGTKEDFQKFKIEHNEKDKTDNVLYDEWFRGIISEKFNFGKEISSIGYIPISDKKLIKMLYDNDILIERHRKDMSRLRIEIDPKHGYRFVKDYMSIPDFEKADTISVELYELFPTYDIAEQIVKNREKKVQECAELSDYDWSVREIDHELQKFLLKLKNNSVEDAENGVAAVREFLLSQKNVEDIEVRTSSFGIQWKYDKQKRWKNILLSNYPTNDGLKWSVE